MFFDPDFYDWKEPEFTKGPRLFISYSSVDRVFVDRLMVDLKASRLEVWIDHEEIHPGDSIPDGVSSGLTSCDFFLLVLSSSSVDSRWVGQELNAALMLEIDKRSLKIVPLVISDCTIPVLLRQRRYIDFRQDYSSGLLQLFDGINSALRSASDKSDAPERHRSADVEREEEELSESINVSVLFVHTGERFRVKLPLDLRCDVAARRIVGDLFLAELPSNRREAYLRNSEYALLKHSKPEKIFGKETVRDAGFGEGDEIRVATRIEWFWNMDANMAASHYRANVIRCSTSPSYRFYCAAFHMIGKRMYARINWPGDPDPLLYFQDQPVNS